jgi:hypothetical protein
MRHRERRSQALGAPFLPERARRRVVQDPHLPGSASNEDPGHLSNLRPGLPFPSSEGESPGGVSETTSETRLSARWTPSSTTPRQDVQEQQGDDDDCRGDSDDGNGGGGHDHAALISLLRTGETLSTVFIGVDVNPAQTQSPRDALRDAAVEYLKRQHRPVFITRTRVVSSDYGQVEATFPNHPWPMYLLLNFYMENGKWTYKRSDCLSALCAPGPKTPRP